jgi:hypothetical protein
MRLLPALLVLALAFPADGATRLRKPPPGRGFQTRVGQYAIAPGADVEVCEYRRLANKKPIDVSGFKLRMPPGAHHFAVWTYGGAVTDDAQFPQGPVESVGCAGVAPDELIPQLLIPTTTPNAEYRFPPGVALRLEAREQVFLNPHMRNPGSSPVVPDVRFNLYRAKKGSVQHFAEGLTFGNSGDIAIPAGGDQTLTAEWVVPFDLTIIHLSTHQHRLGTYANVELVEPDGVTRTLLVESHDWEHPDSVWPQGGLRLAKGRKLRVTCSWHNTDPHEVRFGPETTDEMCYGIGFFYRNGDDPSPVAGSGCVPNTRGLLCPFAPSLPN